MIIRNGIRVWHVGHACDRNSAAVVPLASLWNSCISPFNSATEDKSVPSGFAWWKIFQLRNHGKSQFFKSQTNVAVTATAFQSIAIWLNWPVPYIRSLSSRWRLAVCFRFCYRYSLLYFSPWCPKWQDTGTSGSIHTIFLAMENHSTVWNKVCKERCWPFGDVFSLFGDLFSLIFWSFGFLLFQLCLYACRTKTRTRRLTTAF